MTEILPLLKTVHWAHSLTCFHVKFLNYVLDFILPSSPVLINLKIIQSCRNTRSNMAWCLNKQDKSVTFPSRSSVVNWPRASAWDSMAKTIRWKRNKSINILHKNPYKLMSLCASKIDNQHVMHTIRGLEVNQLCAMEVIYSNHP